MATENYTDLMRDPVTGALIRVAGVRRVPAGTPDYLGLQPLVDVDIRPGMEVTYDGRPAIVCVPPPKGDRLGYSLHEDVLIRYLDGGRERVLVNPYEVAVGIDL